jgi:hypothetical protein
VIDWLVEPFDQRLSVALLEVSVTLPPAQKLVGPLAVIVGVAGKAWIVRSLTFALPRLAGLDEFTLIRYPAPAGRPFGKVATMVPALVPTKLPMVNGAEKLPEASEISAVKTFPFWMTPLREKGTATCCPAQNGDPRTESVETNSPSTNKVNTSQGYSGSSLFEFARTLLFTANTKQATIAFRKMQDLILQNMPITINSSNPIPRYLARERKAATS